MVKNAYQMLHHAMECKSVQWASHHLPKTKSLRCTNSSSIFFVTSDGSKSHLFWNHTYLRTVLLLLAEVLNSSIMHSRSSRMCLFPLLAAQISDWETLQKYVINSFISLHHGGYYEMQQVHLLDTSGLQRNKRLDQDTLRPPNFLLKQVIKDIRLFYRPDSHRKNCCQFVIHLR